jgi:hypothetical protein
MVMSRSIRSQAAGLDPLLFDPEEDDPDEEDPDEDAAEVEAGAGVDDEVDGAEESPVDLPEPDELTVLLDEERLSVR